jgi:microcystin-dependent protein
MSDIIAATERAGIEAGSGTERPLTDEERAVIQRLLSDPFSYPQQFKTWLVSFLEGSDLLLPRSSVQGLTDLLGSGGGVGIMGLLPAGMIFPYGGTVPPTGAELCNGASYAIAGKYNRLFTAIGYAFGGSGANFNVPDLRRRVPFGLGSGVPIATNDARAETNRHIKHHHEAGSLGATAVGDHSHGISGGGHEHNYNVNYDETVQQGTAGTTVAVASDSTYSGSTGGGGGHSHSISGGGSHGHDVSGETSGGFDQDQPSFLTVGFIINY